MNIVLPTGISGTGGITALAAAICAAIVGWTLWAILRNRSILGNKKIKE